MCGEEREDLSRVVASEESEAQFADAVAIAERAGQQVASASNSLSPRQRRSIITAFRRHLFPPGKPGRRRNEEITAAYADWTGGMRGLTLYRKYIRRFDRMSHWQRQVKTRALLDAIRARKRREQRASRTAGDPHS
jgi:hypothetical protein